MSDPSVLRLARDGGEEDQLIPKPSAGELGREYGVPMNLPFSTAFTGTSGARTNDDGKYEILRWDDLSVTQLVEMRKHDGQARALYRLITLPIRSALRNSTVMPEDGDDGEAEFCDLLLNLPPNAGGMTVSFHRVIAQMLMAIFDGFAPFELVYWQPVQGPLAGYFTLKKIAYRPANTITFLVDENGGFAGFHQRASFQGRVVDTAIARENAVYYAANEEENPFYGVSYFNSAFYHYDAKVKLYYLAHLAAQVRAVGTRIGKYPANAAGPDKDKFFAALRDFGTAQAMMIPMEYEVTTWAPSGTYDFMPLIAHHNSQMSKSVLAQFFDESDGSKTALVDFSENNSGMFFLQLTSIMDEIEAIINNYILPRFIDWNFGTACYPKFKFGPFTDEQKKAINTIFTSLSTVALTSQGVTPEFMRKLEETVADDLGIEVDYDAVKKREEEEKAQSQAQQIAMGLMPDPNADPNDPTMQQDTPPPQDGPPQGDYDLAAAAVLAEVDAELMALAYEDDDADEDFVILALSAS